MGKKWKQWQTSFSWAPKSLLTMTAAMKLKDACSLESYDKPRQHIKKQRHHFVNEGLYGQSYGFSSSHIWVWELDHKEDWVQKNWYFPIVALEKTVESPLACREIEPVNPKGNQPWIVIGRTVAKAEAPILGHLMQRAHSLEKKNPESGKDWRQKERGTAEVEMVRQRYSLSGPEFEQTRGDSGIQRSLAGYSPLGCKQSDTT